MHAVTLVLGSACFLSFVWGIFAHFRRAGPVAVSMHATSVLSFFGFLWFIYRDTAAVLNHEDRALWADIVAVLSFVLAFTVFWWAVAATRNRRLTLAFTPDRPAFLHTSGPYAYVRHPFYSAYLTFWVGTAVAGGGLYSWPVPIVMAGLYIAAARSEEKKFVGSSLSPTYEVYRQRTGMLFPMLVVSRYSPGFHP